MFVRFSVFVLWWTVARINNLTLSHNKTRDQWKVQISHLFSYHIMLLEILEEKEQFLITEIFCARLDQYHNITVPLWDFAVIVWFIRQKVAADLDVIAKTNRVSLWRVEFYSTSVEKIKSGDFKFQFLRLLYTALFPQFIRSLHFTL